MYGWEPFLSERDKLHDLQWGKKELSGFGTRPALVLIDMYYSVVGLTREPIFESMKTWPGSMGLEGWAAVDKTAELLAVARETGVPVVHVKGLNNGMKPWVHRKPRPSTMSPEMKRKGEQICDEVAPIAGEVVIEKTAPSGFQGTPLAFHLISMGIDTVILCGESTSGCLRASAVDAATHRFKVGVPMDCAYDRTEASHWMNLYDMHQKYADVVDAEMAKAYFRKLAAASEPAITRLSQALYFWESNTRSATIIGAVGAGGIGLKLIEAMRTNQDWENVAYMVILILIVVFVFDNVSNVLRSRLIGRPAH